MPKEVLYHYVQMKRIIVPDECPTNDFSSMDYWLWSKGIEAETIKSDTRDFEIVEVGE